MILQLLTFLGLLFHTTAITLFRYHPIFSDEAGIPLNYMHYCVLLGENGNPIDAQQYAVSLNGDSQSFSTSSGRC